MAKDAPLIGTATELVGQDRRVQKCTGTYRGDLPDPQFRFNVLFVQHDESFPMHDHEYSELVFVLEGRAIHGTDLEQYPVAQGDVFVVNRPTRHGFTDPAGLKLCNVQYDPAMFLSGQRELARMMGFHALFDLEPRWPQPAEHRPRLRLTPAQLAEAMGLVHGMADEFRGRAEGRETMIRSLFVQLATLLSRLYSAARRKSPTPVARLANALAYARTHFREPIRIAQLAKISCLSPSQFQRAFKRAFRMTPVRMVNEIRVDEARELLRDETHDIAGVARETGFASASFFSTQFRRITGMTPSEYRKQHRNGTENGRP